MDRDMNGNAILRRTAYRNASCRIREIIKTITETAEKQAKSKPECAVRRTRNSHSKSLAAKRRKHIKSVADAKENEIRETSTTVPTNHRRKRDCLESKTPSGSEVRELKRIKSDPGTDESLSPKIEFEILTPTQDTMTISSSPVHPLVPLAMDCNGNKVNNDDPAFDLQLAVLADCDGDRYGHFNANIFS